MAEGEVKHKDLVGDDLHISKAHTLDSHSEKKLDILGEKTVDAGVTVDDCLIKDGKVADSNKLEGSTKAQVIEPALLKAGGTMTGDLAISAHDPVLKLVTVPGGVAEFKILLDAVEMFHIGHDDEEGELVNSLGDFTIGVPGNTLRLSAVLVVADGCDIEVLDKTKGLILRSPNDSRFRLKVADDGTLSTEAV